MNRFRRLGALLAAVTLAATGCTAARKPPAPAPPAAPSPSPAATPSFPQQTAVPAGQVTVSAAATLAEPFTALGKEFEKAYPGTKVVFNFGASSTLARQIVAGPPPDVFAAGTSDTMKLVTDAGAAQGAPKVLVQNRLVIAVSRQNPAKVTGFANLIGAKVKVALCAVPAPCGEAAKKVLDAAGVKITPATTEPDATAALTKVKLGTVDAALVYRTEATAAGADVASIDFEQSAKAVDDYSIVALKSAPNPIGAAAFIGFASSAFARHVYVGAGFGLP
jgi:molybdate transport system substrate-binding protein